MPAFPISIRLEPRRLKSIATFTAEDPWNGGAPAMFNLDLYRMAPVGTRKVREGWWSGKDVYGIRSTVDDKERVLPEALSELWSTKAIPAEALPRLLADIHPRLRPADVTPLLHMRAHRWLAGFLGVMALLFAGVAVRARAGSGGPSEAQSTIGRWLARAPVENEYVVTDGPVPIAGTVDVDFSPRVPPGVFAAESGGRYVAAWFPARTGSRLLFAARALAPALSHLALVGVTVRPEEIGFPDSTLAELRARVPGLDTRVITALYWTATESGPSRGAGGWFFVGLAVMAALGAAIVYLMIAAPQARRRAQMAWLLARR